jgi:protocatechuate 3,4-dioxygenase alpha subunit
MRAELLDNQSPELFGQTPSQTVGPFFHYALPWKGCADLVGSSEIGARPELFPAAHYVLALPSNRMRPEGQVIEIVGKVTDGNGQAVPDALIEIWQADAAGNYPGARRSAENGFRGFGRSSTSEEGEYAFRTVRPGRVAGPDNDLQAPHIAVSVLGRGLLQRLITRLYFSDGAGNMEDPVLNLVPVDRRQTLIASLDRDDCWRFDIVLQGPSETVFFEL